MLSETKIKNKNETKIGTFRYFCQETTLEGWRYLNLENRIWRFLWFLFLASACCVSVYDLFISINKYMKSTTMLALDRDKEFHIKS